jgi:hypothetical protein
MLRAEMLPMLGMEETIKVSLVTKQFNSLVAIKADTILDKVFSSNPFTV